MSDEEKERLVREVDNAERDLALPCSPAQMRYYVTVLKGARRALATYAKKVKGERE